MTKQSTAVLGAGSWGTALALVLAGNKHDVYLWDINSDLVEQLKSERENKRYIPSVSLPENIYPVLQIEEIPEQTELFVMAVPCHALRQSLQLLSRFPKKKICLACKGFETGTQKLNHVVVEEELNDADIGVLTGPSFAKEVANKLPTAVTLAADNLNIAQSFTDYFHDDFFRVYTHDDIVGAQVGGAVKNVMAIAAGIADGLGFGANTRAALITRGLNEITQLGMAMGGKQETFMGLSCLGDLILTCTDDQSRNRRLGLLLAKGLTVDQASEEIGQAIEGLKTAVEVGELAKTYNIEMPITEQVIRVLTDQSTPKDAVQNLLSREQKAETE